MREVFSMVYSVVGGRGGAIFQAPAIQTDNTVTFTGSVVLDLILVGGLIVSVFALVWFVKRM